MRDTQLFEQALGLGQPWRVVRSAFDAGERRLDVYLDFERGATFACPECGDAGCRAHDTAEKSWRHLNFFQHEAHLHARVPRVRCGSCGVRLVEVPWARRSLRMRTCSSSSELRFGWGVLLTRWAERPLDSVLCYGPYPSLMTATASGLTIGELARHSSVGVETIRFYERCGLIAQPERPGIGYRRYPAEAASRLRFIQRAKELGFTLRETEELLTLRDSPGVSTAEVKERAQHKLADIDARIRDLIEMRAQLAALTETCDGVGSAYQCSILAAIGSGPSTESPQGETEHHG